MQKELINVRRGEKSQECMLIGSGQIKATASVVEMGVVEDTAQGDSQIKATASVVEMGVVEGTVEGIAQEKNEACSSKWMPQKKYAVREALLPASKGRRCVHTPDRVKNSLEPSNG